MSTLQHLGFTTNPASSLLQSPQISLNGQFTSDLSNVSWNNQPSTSWFDQAKVAAMYNSMLQSTVNDHAQTQLESMVEQSLKVAAAAAAARAPSSISSAALNLATQQAANVNAFTNATMPIMAAVAAAANPLSSIPNSFFSSAAVDTHQQQQIMTSTMQQHHQQQPSQNYHNIQPNVTSVSATIIIPNSTSTNFINSTNPITSLAKDVTFDDLSMFDFNDLEMFPPTKTSSTTNISSIFPTPSEVDNNIIKTTEPSISDFNIPPQQPSSSKMTTKLSREMETDKELNHWLSLAVGGNLPDEDVHGSPLSNYGEPGNDHMDLFSAETTGISLDPIMFTPPDSPTHNEPKEKRPPVSSLNLTSESSPSKTTVATFPNASPQPDISPQPTVESLIFMPKPQIDGASNRVPTTVATFPNASPHPDISPQPTVESLIFMPKPQNDGASNRVPVYKQKKSIFSAASITLEKALNKVVKSKKADEYSFTDDEEEEQPLSKSAGFDFFSDDSRTATGDNDMDPKSQEPVENTVSKKKSVAEPKPLAQVEELKEELKQEKNNVAEIIRKRKENLKKLSHVFLYSEILEGDDVITPGANFLNDEEDENEKLNVSDSAQSPETMEFLNEEDENDSPPLLTAPYCEPSSSNGIPILRIKTEIPDLANSPSQIAAAESTDEVFVKDEEAKEPERVLPKLVIKLRRESVTSPIPKKRKKKHKKKKDDTDWEPSEKKRKKHKNKHRHHREHVETSIISNTAALMDDKKPKLSFINGFTKPSPFTDPSVIERLSYFGEANGDSPKGTFVVCKQDLFKTDCPLWKVDNQNLLQKYPQINENSGLKLYKNSSTYSGWCDQVAAGYIVVQVKYHKHTRAETIVEPHIPINDLLPAITELSSSTFTNDDGFGLRDEPIIDDIFEPLPSGSINNTMSSVKTTVRSHMRAFTQAMLRHAASLTFLQAVKDSNDWDYLCALNEVENMTILGKQKINDRVRWGQRFEVMLTVYANVAITNEYKNGEEVCQACGEKIANKYLNLYSNESYNYDSLEIEELPDIDGGTPLVAIQFCICSRCSNLALTYHRLHHMRYTTFRYCEDMIENMSILRPDLSLDALITLCLSKRSWQRKLINEYAVLWRKVQENEL
uniref:DUF4211 domain-containing protein n=1 Tax=Panagrolaimus sp. ES5 TaxID=591445 RepID=A0AC34FN56_9BILA